MFIATNRRIDATRTGADVLLDTAADDGVVHWIEGGRMQGDRDLRPVGEERAVRALRERACRGDRAVVLYVHGFGTDVESLIEHGAFFDERYGVETLAFSWPGEESAVLGFLRYPDARERTGDASRALAHVLETVATQRTVVENARACGSSVNGLFHSMGCHLLERLVTEFEVTDLALDNLLLVAPDVAVDGHSEWLRRVHVRGRIWVVVNEWDYALAGSRMQVGTSGVPRLGQHLTEERAPNVTYIDLSGLPAVGPSHGYYANLATELDDRVATLFERLVNGGDPDDLLRRGEDGVHRLA